MENSMPLFHVYITSLCAHIAHAKLTYKLTLCLVWRIPNNYFWYLHTCLFYTIAPQQLYRLMLQYVNMGNVEKTRCAHHLGLPQPFCLSTLRH